MALSNHSKGAILRWLANQWRGADPDSVFSDADVAALIGQAAADSGEISEFGDVTVGHVNVTSSSAPTIVAAAGLGSGDSPTPAVAIVNAADGAGEIWAQRGGAGGTSGLQATITWSQPYATTPQIQLSANTDLTARALSKYYIVAINSQTAGLYCSESPADHAGELHVFGYTVTGVVGAPVSGQLIRFLGKSEVSDYFGEDLVITKPAGVQLYTHMLMRIVIAPGSNADAYTVTASGWAEELRTEFGNNGYSQILFSRTAGSSEPEAYTVTANAPVMFSGDIVARSGANIADAWQDASEAEDESQFSVAPGITVTTASSLAVLLTASVDTSRSVAPLGFESRVALDGRYVDERVANAGPTGDITTVYPSSQAWVAQLVILKPEPV